MTLQQIENDLEKEIQSPALISLYKIALYAEIVLMIVQFAKERGVWKDGKLSIRIVHWIPIITLFRQVLNKLKSA
jgi:hypothetical protein